MAYAEKSVSVASNFIVDISVMGGKISVNEEIYVYNMYRGRKEKFKVLGIRKEGVDINTADIGENVTISITEIDITGIPYFVTKGYILCKKESPQPIKNSVATALIYIYSAAEGGNVEVLENELNIAYLFNDN